MCLHFLESGQWAETGENHKILEENESTDLIFFSSSFCYKEEFSLYEQNHLWFNTKNKIWITLKLLFLRSHCGFSKSKTWVGEEKCFRVWSSQPTWLTESWLSQLPSDLYHYTQGVYTLSHTHEHTYKVMYKYVNKHNNDNDD